GEQHQGPHHGHPPRADARPAAGDVPAGAAYAQPGRTAGAAVQAEQGDRRALPLAGAGRRVRRQRLRAAAPHRRYRRHAVAADPQPGVHAHHRREAGGGGQAVHGQGRLAGARQGAEHPHHRLRPGLHRADQPAGRPDPGDGGGDAHLQAARRRPGGDGLHRRRGDVDRRLSRGRELRRRAEAAARRHRREQPLGVLDAVEVHDRGQVVRRQGAGLRDGRRAGGRQRHAGRLRRVPARGGARQVRRGRHADRGDDVPPQGPRAARRANLRGPGRDRALGQHQRPHRPLRQGAAGQRLGHRAGADGHRRADRPRAGRGRGRSREEPASRAPGSADRRVRRRPRERPVDAPRARRPHPSL
ncbi:MAG: Branched-chain alpha-keto acid dehydrogenase, E1 component, alpha subunit, partial [uncultured Gemmatimonadetes bacterium]